MDVLINKLLDKFENGKLSRRRLIETLAVTAMTVYAADTAIASEAVAAAGVPAPDRVHLDTLMVNHISYTCPDYRIARDFYSDLMGMHVVNETSDASNPQSGQAYLAFYGKDETPLGQPKGTPSPFVIARSRQAAAPAPAAGANAAGQRGAAPQSQVTIDHIAYTIADWDAKKVEAILKARGLNPSKDTDYSFHVTDPHGYDLQISGIGMTAFN